MTQAKATIIELDRMELEEILRRVEAQQLEAEDYATIRAVIEAYVGLTLAVEDKNTTIRRLRQMLFGAKTEKTRTVVGRRPKDGGENDEAASASAGSDTAAAPAKEGDTKAPPESDAETDARPPRRGHGRNGAAAYTGAEKINVQHPTLTAGAPCQQCPDGTLYEMKRPGVLVRLVGQAPVGARVYYLQKLRCGLCGAMYTAPSPAEAGSAKYDATVGSMIALLKYGSGMPFHRAEQVQASLGIPLPASTQWDIVADQADNAEPVYEELIRQAGQGEVVYNDDTTVKILEVMGERARQAALAEGAGEEMGEGTGEDAGQDGLSAATGAAAAEKELAAERSAKRSPADRKGTYTSGIVSTREGRRIALFFSGRQHAGENLADVLARRAAELPPPIQMCDALARNSPGELATILGNCLSHGRRQFVDVAAAFPEECRCVLESFAVIYKNDATARQRQLSPEERLLFHQAESGPTMEELHAWLVQQLEGRRVERNSSLGGAIAYLLRHWEKLTLFLRVPGAPLDNNLCERALKKAILHRKNAYFYKTCRGARVGDLFMSLIHTSELNGANPFEYLTELSRHAGDAVVNPQDWMPWNYRITLEGMADVQTSSEETGQAGRCARAAPQGAGETHESRVD